MIKMSRNQKGCLLSLEKFIFNSNKTYNLNYEFLIVL